MPRYLGRPAAGWPNAGPIRGPPSRHGRPIALAKYSALLTRLHLDVEEVTRCNYAASLPG